VGQAFKELRQYFQEMIDERRSSGSDARISDTGNSDLLGSLVFANANTQSSDVEEEKEIELKKKKGSLTDDEGVYFR